MLTFSRVKETLNNGKKTIKVEEFGVKTASECLPFGMDSSPIKNMTAIYGKTSNNSESVVIGYINKNQIAKEGEVRFYSLNSSGGLSCYVYLRDNGVIELNGDTNFLVKFNELKSELQTLVTNLNTELIKIQTAISTLGGTYAANNLTMNYDLFKNEKIKQNS